MYLGASPSKKSVSRLRQKVGDLDGVATPASGQYGLLSPVEMKARDKTLLPEWAGAAAGRVGVSAIRFRITDDLPHAVTVELKARSNGVESNIVLLPLE